jgi:hypothetical protein
MKTLRITALVVTMAGAAVGLASPATAESLSGSYAVTGEGLQPNVSWDFASCGANCVLANGGWQMHRQGTVWSGKVNDGCMTTIDENNLSGTYQCTSGPISLPPIAIQLAKSG